LEFLCSLTEADCWCTADEVRWKQMLTNLLSNAIKFTNTGSVTVRLLKKEEQAGSIFTLLVSDTGCGIPSSYRSKLFTPFSQATTGHTRQHGGTGLGLYLTKKIVEAWKGDIQVYDNNPVGTTFTVTMPVNIARSDASISTTDSNASAVDALPCKDGRVLVVEDNAMLQMVVSKGLARLGIQADLATDGTEAIKKAATVPYDIILMDCQMPIMDGFTATRCIRSMPATVQPVIIAMTALAVTGDRERCLSAGMDEYLSKPFTQAQLRCVLAKSLAQVTQRRQRPCS